jgi:hypothetical protein
MLQNIGGKNLLVSANLENQEGDENTAIGGI